MMTCIVVDDNPLARLAVKNMLSDVEDLKLIGDFEDGVKAFNFLQRKQVDLLLLDVEMPGMTGLELLKSLEHQPLVILITSKTDYAVEGFDLKVVDYIVKPVDFPRLLKAINRAMEKDRWRKSTSNIDEADTSDVIFVKSNNQFYRIDLREILFIQALGDYVNFVTKDKKYPVHSTMKMIEERLPSNLFLRVHRSYIVALDKISNLEQNSLQIDQHIVPVSESYKKALMDKLNIL